MPKRRMTPARRKQIKQWQRAGVKARKGKTITFERGGKIRTWPFERYMARYLTGKTPPTGVPTGKTSLLYHHTDPETARKIVKAQRFKGFSRPGYVFFSTPHDSPLFKTLYGDAIVGVKVPRKKVKSPRGRSFPERVVSTKDLAGRKIKRYK